MDQWLADAESILGIAQASWDSTVSEMVIIRDRQGGLMIRDGAGWSLYGLQAAFGAKAVYRVTRNSKRLRLEAVSGSHSRQFDVDAPEAQPPFRPKQTYGLYLHA